MSKELDAMSASPEVAASNSSNAKKRKFASEESNVTKKRKKQSLPDEHIVSTSTEWPVNVLKKHKKKPKPDTAALEVPNTDASAEPPSDFYLPDALSMQESQAQVRDSAQSSPVLEDKADEKFQHLSPAETPAPFRSTRISLYVPLHAIALSTATGSLLSHHLAPLLLTYYPPVKGVVLAFSDPVLSAKPALASNLPLQPPQDITSSNLDTLALAADEYGVSWVWLTVTLLVFTPEKEKDMEGYINICSEGFIGLISYNYFQTGIAKNRIPGSWNWTGPGGNQTSSRKRKGKKAKMIDHSSQDDLSKPMSLDFQEPVPPPNQPEEDGLGFFSDAAGTRMSSSKVIRFRVVDSEVVPVHGREKRSLQLEGSLLNDEEEERMLAEEATKFESMQSRGGSRTPRTSRGGSEALMSGGILLRRKNSETSQTPSGRKHRMAY